MKVIHPEVKLMSIPEPDDRLGVLAHLERIGRICYKSEDKIDEDSCIRFIQNIKNRRHWAMLEHYIFTLSVSKEIYENITSNELLTIDNPDLIHPLSFIRMTHWAGSTKDDYKYIVSGSATTFNYLWECKCFAIRPYSAIPKICQFIKDAIPEIMMDPWHNPKVINSYSNDIRFLSREEISDNLPYNLRLLHDFRSVQFTVDRGVTHELVRHRPASWAQESTRYCNYNSGKHGSEITTIIPCFFDTGMGEASNSLVYDTWKRTCELAEEGYMKLIDEYGATAQQARSILPHSVKADICMTARIGEFRHFFKMRLPKSAHPQMREVVIPLLHMMQEDAVGMFDDMQCRDMNDEFVLNEGSDN